MGTSSTRDELEAVFAYDADTVEYLVNISPAADMLFFEVPKAGCTTIKMAMQYAERPGHMPDPRHVHDREKSPLARISDIDAPPEAIFRGPMFYRFAFVRNPYSRILSAYLDKLVHNEWERQKRLPALGFASDAHPSFARFLEIIASGDPTRLDIHWMPQSILLNPDYVEYDDIFRFEDFEAGLEKIMHRLRIDRRHWGDIAPAGRRHGTGASDLLDEYYSEREIDLVSRIYGADFERFGYEPGNLRQLGATPRRQVHGPLSGLGGSGGSAGTVFEKEWFLRSALGGIQQAVGRDPALPEAENRLMVALVTDALDALGDGRLRFRDIFSFLGFCIDRAGQSRAQLFQDLWVLQQLDEKRDGFFVEFGACDGLHLSNTHLLERAYGWSGILCEPNPAWHEALAANRTAAIDTRCVAPRSGEEIDLLCPEDRPELARMRHIVPDDIHERNGNRRRHRLTRCQSVSLTDLLAEHDAPRQIDYISVDTEGSEYEILAGFDFERYDVTCWTIENGGEPDKAARISALMREKGYRHWRPGISRWDSWFTRR